MKALFTTLAAAAIASPTLATIPQKPIEFQEAQVPIPPYTYIATVPGNEFKRLVGVFGDKNDPALAPIADDEKVAIFKEDNHQVFGVLCNTLPNTIAQTESLIQRRSDLANLGRIQLQEYQAAALGCVAIRFRQTFAFNY